MTARAQLLFWSAAFILFVGFIMLFKSILLPFVVGIVVAYLLGPLLNALGRKGVSRGPAALLILFVFFLFIAGFVAAFIPLAYQELLLFLQDLPGYLDRIWAMFLPLSQRVQGLLGIDAGNGLTDLLGAQPDSAVNVGKTVAGGLLAGGRAILNLMAYAIIVPIVAYFVMKEWANITNWAKDLMPRQYKDTILQLIKRIDRKVAGFIRGQLTVAFVLGVCYAVALTLAGLKYGFLIGLLSGVLSVVPLLGSFTGFVVSIGVAWFQTGEWEFVLLIAAIFLMGQIVETNFITPRILGKNVGLHPLWVFFSIMAGGALFGILGMLIAVPVAAVVSVLLGFAVEQYKNSPFYKSEHAPRAEAEKTPPKAGKKTK